jgi:Tfp pilus assembly protein FimT
MEIILVLTVLALVAGMSWPYFEAWFQAYRLQEGVDIVRTHWIKARTQAMEEGRPYRFWWQANTGQYRLAPDDVEHWPDMPGVGTSGGGYPAGLLVENVLPEGVVFQSGDGGGLEQDSIVFQPDGTARLLTEDGLERPETLVLLTDRRGYAYALQLRAMTGVVTVVNVGRLGP